MDHNFKMLKLCLYMDQTCGFGKRKYLFLRSIINPCYSVLYTFWLGSFFRQNKRLFILPYLIVCLWHRWNSYKTGIQLIFGTKIGPGLTFAHYGSIVINPASIVGTNCLIYQGVTIGSKRRGKKTEAPIIGNNVILGAGSKVLGNVIIGNNVVVGANAVVTKDIPDNATVVGIPAKVINYDAKETIQNYLKCDNN